MPAVCDFSRRQQIVQHASELLRRYGADGIRIRDVSRAAGISERALRNGFHREHGLSPKQYELRERLASARQALCDVAAGDTVTSIASAHGFSELGRFASRYKHAFGESPSQTIRLRRSARSAD